MRDTMKVAIATIVLLCCHQQAKSITPDNREGFAVTLGLKPADYYQNGPVAVWLVYVDKSAQQCLTVIIDFSGTAYRVIITSIRRGHESSIRLSDGRLLGVRLKRIEYGVASISLGVSPKE